MAITDDNVTPEELEGIVETAEWVEHLPALESGVKLRAGADRLGAMNFQARTLDSRTRYLLAMFNGLTSNGINLIGHLDSEAELNAIPTESLQVGTAYFVDFALRAWNGTIWATSGSLQGARGITLLGTWPDHLPLPNVAENKLGDAYTWNHDVWILVPGTEDTDPNKWENLNIRGKDGKSTYEIWLEIPGNEGGSYNDFMLDQKGRDGDDAPTAWFKRPGNEGKTLADYDAYYKGLKGDTGAPRAAFTVAGAKATTGDLPLPGVETEAWYVGIDLFVWVEADNNYTMIPGLAGKSAYAMWLEKPGNAGKTEAEFWEDQKGRPGNDSTVPGPKGADGRNLRMLGTYPTMNEIVNLEDPNDQDAYCALDTGHLWMYIVPPEAEVGAWTDLGPWRGLNGKSAYEVWLDDGHEGASLADFWNFLRGTSLILRGVVATLGDLPAEPEEQWIYGVRDESAVYIFLDGGWVSLGTFGKDGVDGKSTFQEWKDDGHPEGTLEEFWEAMKGKDGLNLDYIKILTPEDPEPPEATELNKGKAYISEDRYVWINITGDTWQNAGPFQPAGERGADGQMWIPKGMVPTVTDLPPGNTVEKGWAYGVAETGLTHVFDGEFWSAGIDLRSVVPGPQGNDGNPGALMPILDIYQSMVDLEAAHPTGSLGDAYLIVDTTVDPIVRDLVIWSPTASVWVNTGPAGIPGSEGKKGDPGQNSTVPGPQGSRWLNLDSLEPPSNTFNGREGDWAVNKLNRIYYKSPTGWLQWGVLVAGDVNSPLPSEGKVVRYGTTWVALPVDEVTGAVAGKVYGRRKVGETNKTEWVVVPEGIADLTSKNGFQYCRVFEVDGTVPIWKQIAFPDAGIPDVPAPEENALYLRNGFGHTWEKFIKAPSDGKTYVQKNGNFISLDRMDYPIKRVNASDNFDPLMNQLLRIDNSSATAKTITLGGGLTGANERAMLVPVIIVGKVGSVTFAGASGVTLEWDKATVPTITNKLTILSFFWTGDQWVGSVGPKVP